MSQLNGYSFCLIICLCSHTMTLYSTAKVFNLTIIYNLPMKATVCSHVLHRNFISKCSFNSAHNLLACIHDSTDTLAFYHLPSHPDPPQQVFQNTSRPSGKKSTLAWSPDCQFLAVGASLLELWRFNGARLAPAKNYPDDFIDIKLIAWSPDSQTIAYGGLSKKNTVKVRNLQSGNVRDIEIPVTVSGISFDPFGKYLLLLLSSNIVSVHNAGSLGRVASVALSPGAEPSQPMNTVRECRSIDWSPDFSSAVVPSLDDSKIAIAVGLTRHQHFAPSQAFLGHVSSISCARFNPNLYEHNSKTISVLTLGDSHGVVSLWRVSSKGSELIFLSNSQGEEQVVQDLEWSKDGSTLIVNVMKRYLMIISLDKTRFGRELSRSEHSALIEDNFGAQSAAVLAKQDLEIFNPQTVPTQPEPAEEGAKIADKPGREASSAPTPQLLLSNPLSQNVEYVRVNEQKTFTNKNQRKVIKPAMLVPKGQVNSLPQVLAPENPTQQSISRESYPSLGLAPLQSQTKVLRVNSTRFLEVRRLQGHSLVQLVQMSGLERTVLHEKMFTGTVSYLKITKPHVYVFSQGKLMIHDQELSLTELPYCLGEVHRLAVNQQGDVYFLSTWGMVRGFNHLHRQCHTPAPIAIHSLVEGEPEEEEKVVRDFRVEADHSVYLSVGKANKKYLLSRETGCWVSLQMQEGLLKRGHSLSVGAQQSQLVRHFFEQMGNSGAPPVPSNSPIQHHQLSMVYYRNHSPNPSLYQQHLVSLLRQLNSSNQPHKMRQVLRKHFSDPHSEYYQSDRALCAKVRSIGGGVIAEFVQFGLL